MEQFKGYILTNNKIPAETFKNKTSEELKTLDMVENLPEYAGIIENGYLVVDVDTEKESQILFNIVKDLKLNTVVMKTGRGMHFHFKTSEYTTSNKIGTYTGLGIKVDMKLGTRNGYVVLKANGEDREVIYQTDEIQEIPKWLSPINYTPPFIGMKEGERNSTFFNYILTLQTYEFSKKEARETIRLINKYVLENPLPEDELEVILRDEAFNKPVFFGGKNGQTFHFDKFANYLVSQHSIKRISGRLHTYKDGIYVPDDYDIEHQMITYIPTLRQAQRTEVLRYINILIRDETNPSDARYVAFNNGILDVITEEFLDFSDDYIITNKIPWNYNPDAYSELADKTLDKLACNDHQIRALMEEAIGYTFYRRNEMGKAFILTGNRSNGKSTYLTMLRNLLGDDNTSSLDLNELGDRFKTAEVFGKLANIGDDIGNAFIPDTSVFKKLVTGEEVTVERKGEDPFKINNYSKMLFSANDIPRMADRTGAVLRRLIIIPFNATFSPDDPDYDPFIRWKLESPDVMEYLINIGIQGLRRVLANNKFTDSAKVSEQVYQYNLENNPIELFFNESTREDYIDKPTSNAYDEYIGFCHVNNLKPQSRISFSKQVCDRFDLESVQVRVDNKRVSVFKPIRGVVI